MEQRTAQQELVGKTIELIVALLTVGVVITSIITIAIKIVKRLTKQGGS